MNVVRSSQVRIIHRVIAFNTFSFVINPIHNIDAMGSYHVRTNNCLATDAAPMKVPQAKNVGTMIKVPKAPDSKR